MMDLLAGIEADERAMEKIASALTRIAIVMERRFEREFPTRTPRDAVVTKVKSEEDKLRESLGESDEPIDDWFGLREREVIDKKGK